MAKLHTYLNYDCGLKFHHSSSHRIYLLWAKNRNFMVFDGVLCECCVDDVAVAAVLLAYRFRLLISC